MSPFAFKGSIDFICADPLAYSISETTTPHNITADEVLVPEVTGGTGYIKPVYILTANQALSERTFKIKHVILIEEIQWTGALALNDKLEIDVAKFTVKKNGAISMATVSGQFPRLVPATTQAVKVTGHRGDLTIKYRNTYL
jgi:phage-related protein